MPAKSEKDQSSARASADRQPTGAGRRSRGAFGSIPRGVVHVDRFPSCQAPETALLPELVMLSWLGELSESQTGSHIATNMVVSNATRPHDPGEINAGESGRAFARLTGLVRCVPARAPRKTSQTAPRPPGKLRR